MALDIPRLVTALAVAGAVLATAGFAQANDVVMKLDLRASVMATRHDGASMNTVVGQSQPDMLEVGDVRLAEDGMLVGGGFLASFMVDGTRLALGATFFGVRDTRMVHEPLPDGYDVEGGRFWGESLELRLGREFQVGPFFPYVDLRLVGFVMVVNTKLRNDEHGVLGNTQFNRIGVGLGPVGGLFVPLSDDLYADLSGYAGLFGDEKYGGMFALGTWWGL